MTSTEPTRPADRPGPDAELLGRIATGDEQALAHLYDRLAPCVLAIARRRTEAVPAEVLLQAVFVRIWRAAPRFPHQDLTAGAWIVAEIDRTFAAGRG